MADSGGGEDHNKKAPGLGIEDKPPTTHYNYHATADATGKVSVRYDNEDAPDESMHFDLDHNGSYKGSQAKGNGLVTSVTAGHEREYTSKGKGSHADGSTESATNGNQSAVIKGDSGEQSGGSKLEGNQKKVGGSKEGGTSIIHDNQATIIKGNNNLSVDGNLHTKSKGNHVQVVEKSSYLTVKGQYGINVQEGNYDTKVDAGKLRFEVAQNISILGHDQININADAGAGIVNIQGLNKVILSVGDSSITIEQSKITIKSKAIEFIQ